MAKRGAQRKCGHCKKLGHRKEKCPERGATAGAVKRSGSPAVKVIDKELARTAKDLARAQGVVDELAERINKLRGAREVLA